MDIESYLREELESYGYNAKERQGRPLLNFIFDGTRVHPLVGWSMQHCISTLKLLHKYGASTNDIFQERTSWQYALDVILGTNRGDAYEYLPLLTTMLDCGADPNQRLSGTYQSTLVDALRNGGYPWSEETLENMMELIGSFISHGVDLEPDLDEILRKAEFAGRLYKREGLKFKRFLEESWLKERRCSKRKRMEITIRTGKRRASGT
jgi:hypothetical protein